MTAPRAQNIPAILPTDIVTVGVPTLTNATTFFDIEQILTEKVRSEFIGRGKYQVFPETAGTDATLTAPDPARSEAEPAAVSAPRSRLSRSASSTTGCATSATCICGTATSSTRWASSLRTTRTAPRPGR